MNSDALNRKHFWPLLQFLVVTLVVPNIAFWISSGVISTDRRGLFNADYAVIAILYYLIPKAWAAALLGLALVCDALRTIETIYHLSQIDLLNSIAYLRELPLHFVVAVALSISAGLVLIAFATFSLLPKLDRRQLGIASIFLVLFLILLKGIDTINGENGYFRLRESANGKRLVSESVLGFANILRGMLAYSSPPRIPVKSATEDLLKELQLSRHSGDSRVLRTNLVVIVVESMGLPTDPGQRKRLFEPFDGATISDRYRLEIGQVPFAGSTVAGELRELCGVLSGTRVDTNLLAHKGDCLPDLLNAEGYDTLAIHGFDGLMFARRTWYPALGFQQAFFLENIASQSDMHVCPGVFPGICDADIAANVGRRLIAQRPGKPLYIHWMTLNTHLPIHRFPDLELRCSSDPEKDVCELQGLLGETLLAIARLAELPDLPKTEFIVVGDHAPPFAGLRQRGSFDQHDVPYLRLIPKS